MIIQTAVAKETRHIALGAGVCYALLLIAALILGKFSLPVALGGLLGGACAVFCFFLLGLSVQKLCDLQGTEEEKLKAGKLKMRGSYTLRLVIMALVFLLSVNVSCFNWVATAVMLLSPRVAVMLVPAAKKLFAKKNANTTEEVKEK